MSELEQQLCQRTETVHSSSSAFRLSHVQSFCLLSLLFCIYDAELCHYQLRSKSASAGITLT